MWKKLAWQIGSILLRKGVALLFKSADKNNDGKITKEEAYNYVVDVLDDAWKKFKQR